MVEWKVVELVVVMVGMMVAVSVGVLVEMKVEAWAVNLVSLSVDEKAALLADVTVVKLVEYLVVLKVCLMEIQWGSLKVEKRVFVMVENSAALSAGEKVVLLAE